MRTFRAALVTTVLILWGAAVLVAEETVAPVDFIGADTATYKLLESNEWDKLIETGEAALDNGIDYFYLRMRMGIAYYNKGEYINAATQFDEALDFNSGDETAMEYLYYSYLFSANTAKVNYLQQRLPQDLRERLNTRPLLLESPGSAGGGMINEVVPARAGTSWDFKEVAGGRVIEGASGSCRRGATEPRFFDGINTEYGVTASNNESLNSGIDIDGRADKYGEFNRADASTYYHAGLMNWLGSDLSLYYGYTGISINMTKQVRFGNVDTIDKYRIQQTQIYVSPSWQVGRNTKITPAVNFINVAYTTINPAYNTTTSPNVKDKKSTTLNDYVASLALSHDFGRLTCTLFDTYSELSKSKQSETGVSLLFFPGGDDNTYTNTTVTCMTEQNADSKTIFDQLLGVHLAGALWAEGDLTVGKLKNFNEKNAYVVYNLGDDIKSKWGISLLLYPSADINLSLRYTYANKESSYVTYTSATASETHTADYQATSLLGGLQWKF